jgi:signal transduction histidine kinase
MAGSPIQEPPNESIGEVSPSELADFLRSRREVIVERWHQAIADRPANQGLSRQSLIDHIPDLLDAIAETGEAYRTDPRARIGPESAEQHAVSRLMEGLDLSQVVVELAVLRDCVLEVWDKERAPGAARPEVRFLNRSVDRAITASIERYVASRDRTLRALDRISAAALECRRLEDLLDRLLRVLAETTPAIDTGVVLLREDDHLVVRAAVGLEEGALRDGLQLRIGQGFSGRIAAERRPVHLESDTEQATVACPMCPEKRLRCLYGLPLVDDGKLIAVAHVGSTTAPSFSDQDKHLFQSMAARATSGIVQHQLREASDRRASELAAVVESVPDAMFVGDRSGIHTANRVALDLMGVDSVGELNVQAKHVDTQFRIRHASTGEATTAATRPFARALKGERVVDDFVLRNETTGREVIMRMAAAPVRVGGRVSGAVLVASDVTLERKAEEERHRLYEQARQAVADREHALAVVSHDLRNPLNVINLAVFTLEARPDPNALAKTTASIRKAVTRMTRLISDLLDFSSIQAGQLSFKPAPVEAAAIVEEAAEAIAAEASAKGLEVRVSTMPLLVRADRDRLLQALGNLLGNAVKVTREGAVSASVRLTDEGTHALFAVSDTGPGIPEQLHEQIFQPYWRAREPVYKGTGLGLAIVRGIVESHGGRIWITKGDGRIGTTFHFTVPKA